MKIIETPIYTIDELDEKARGAAREWWREGLNRGRWWDTLYEDFAGAATVLGVDITRRWRHWAIYFDLYGSSGSWVAFEGFLTNPPSPHFQKVLRENYPTDKGLHKIGARLGALQKAHHGLLRARITSIPHGRMTVDVESSDHQPTFKQTEEVEALVRALADWMQDRLRQESDWQQADEQVDEALRANEYTFTADGKRFGG